MCVCPLDLGTTSSMRKHTRTRGSGVCPSEMFLDSLRWLAMGFGGELSLSVYIQILGGGLGNLKGKLSPPH